MDESRHTTHRLLILIDSPVEEQPSSISLETRRRVQCLVYEYFKEPERTFMYIISKPGYTYSLKTYINSKYVVPSCAIIEGEKCNHWVDGLVSLRDWLMSFRKDSKIIEREKVDWFSRLITCCSWDHSLQIENAFKNLLPTYYCSGLNSPLRKPFLLITFPIKKHSITNREDWDEFQRRINEALLSH